MFGHMKIYTVHVKDTGAKAQDMPVFVHEGFSIPAFLLTFLWAFYHRLWVAGLLLLTGNLLVMTLVREGIIAAPSVVLLNFALQWIAGLFANDWLRASLKRRGYFTADIVAGDSLVRAEQRYFDRALGTA